MNILWINIVLAILGIGATLSAFGGETWRKGKTKIISRITLRGWLSLVFLFLAFIVGITKEVIQYRQGELNTLKSKQLKLDNKNQRDRIELLVSKTSDLQNKLDASTKDLEDVAENLGETTEKISQQQLASIESAFKLAIKIPRETDDAVVHLRGQDKIVIPSRYYEQMELYWGDQFHFTIMAHDIPTERLATLKLQVGERTYPLHSGQGSSSFEQTLRIYGNSPDPMSAVIINPLRLKEITLKVFVRTTDSSQGQNEFRRLVLNSPFSEFAKKMYKVTTADILNVRSNPEKNAQIRSRLSKGSFVRSLQSIGEWTEVMTPEGRQGWLASKYLGNIN
jgi:hypothetical protein